MGSTFGYSWCNDCGCIVCAVGCVVGCVFIFGCSTTVLLFYGLFYAFSYYCLVFTYYCFYAFSYYCLVFTNYCYYSMPFLLLIGCTTFSTSILSISSLSKSSTTLLILVTFFYFSLLFFLFLAVVLIVGFDIVGFIYYSY